MEFESEEYAEAVKFYRKIIMPGDVLLVEDWVNKRKSSSKADVYLKKHCNTVQRLEDFFRENSHYFFVENGRVALHDEEFEIAIDMAEEYFKKVLMDYNCPVNFTSLKQRHLAVAPDIIRELFRQFYPVAEFKKFFKSRPDVFSLHKNLVFLIGIESVDFFKKRLKTFGRNDLRFTDFRGHVAQAPPHIQRYINRNFPGNEFEMFLRSHPDVFHINEDGFLSLVGRG